MTDERFVYVNDLKEKKQTARSAHNKRTHCGKGGSVRLPSDNMTRKELKAMNGEVNSYKMNEPMKWAEFKAMPDDLKVAYIKALRERYRVPTIEIYAMLGGSKKLKMEEFKRLGLCEGKGKFERDWDKEGFYAWAHGETHEPEGASEEEETRTAPIGKLLEPTLLPASGVVTHEGDARKALESLARLFGDEPVRITISWDKMPQAETEAAV